MSFKCRETEKLYHRETSGKFPASIQKAALRKLWIIDAGESLEDLRSPPGNRLERLYGDRQGKYSIRINNQFRICFIWREINAHDVEIVDYH
jgi:toxin HigB-1